MTRLPSRPRNSDNSPLVPAEQRKIPRRPRKRVSAMLSVAQDYAAVGLPVIPLAPGDKRPITPHGKDDATTDANRTGVWWTRWLTANVGAGLSRVVGPTRGGQGR